MPGILWFWHQTPMTPEIIEAQLTQMHTAGFRGRVAPSFMTRQTREIKT